MDERPLPFHGLVATDVFFKVSDSQSAILCSLNRCRTQSTSEDNESKASAFFDLSNIPDKSNLLLNVSIYIIKIFYQTHAVQDELLENKPD